MLPTLGLFAPDRPQCGHLAPLVAARRYGVALIGIMPGAGRVEIPRHTARTVILVGADMGFATSPAAFDRRTLRRAIAVSELIALAVGDGGDAYTRAAETALAGGNALIVELASTADADAWLELIDAEIGR